MSNKVIFAVHECQAKNKLELLFGQEFDLVNHIHMEIRMLKVGA